MITYYNETEEQDGWWNPSLTGVGVMYVSWTSTAFQTSSVKILLILVF